MIELQDVQSRPTLTIRTLTTADAIGAACGDVLPAVHGYMQSKGLAPAGPPFVIYHAYSMERVDMEGGLPLSEPHPGEGRIQAGTLPGGRAAVSWHLGPYQGLAHTHAQLRQFCEDRKTPSTICWEIYWTDPGAEPDAQKWKTEVIFLLGE